MTEALVKYETGLPAPTREELAKQIAAMFVQAPAEARTIAVLMCQRYNLDPLAKHLILIPSHGRWTAYITRDGMEAVAHMSRIGWSVSFRRPEKRMNPYSNQEDIWLEGTLYRTGYPANSLGLWLSECVTRGGDGKLNDLWDKRPSMGHQKAVELHLLRRSFNIAVPLAPLTDIGDEPETVESNGVIVDGDTGEILTPDEATPPAPLADVGDLYPQATPKPEPRRAETPGNGDRRTVWTAVQLKAAIALKVLEEAERVGDLEIGDPTHRKLMALLSHHHVSEDGRHALLTYLFGHDGQTVGSKDLKQCQAVAVCAWLDDKTHDVDAELTAVMIAIEAQAAPEVAG